MLYSLEHIRAVIEDYTLYLFNDGRRPPLHHPVGRVDEPGYLHASSLGFCSNAQIRERRGATVFPSLLPAAMPATRMRMLEGVRMAEIVQEAFVWHGIQRPDLYVETEAYFKSPVLRLQGNMDVFMYWGKDATAIEVKHRAYAYNRVPGPRMSDLLQMIAYYHLLNEKYNLVRVALAVVSTPGWREQGNERSALRLYRLKRRSDDQGFELIDEDDELVEDYGEPLFVSHKRFQDIVDNFSYPDKLNPFESWECGYIEKKPANGNAGRFRPRCPYWCHDTMPKDGEVTIAFHGEDEERHFD